MSRDLAQVGTAESGGAAVVPEVDPETACSMLLKAPET
jgi:hypothetical protein